jgi:hypothetical protein
MGATIVCVFGACVAAISAVTRMRNADDLADGGGVRPGGRSPRVRSAVS